MNKIILTCALLSLNAAIYAAAAPEQMPPANSAAPVGSVSVNTAPTSVVATPSKDNKAPAAKKAPVEHKPSSNNNGSVYESISSGWNSFIDLLAPPNK